MLPPDKSTLDTRILDEKISLQKGSLWLFK